MSTNLSAQTFAQVEVDKAYSDSLYAVYHKSDKVQDKIAALKELTNLYWQSPEEVGLTKLVIKLSMEIHAHDDVYNGMAGLCRYYFNEGVKDSLIYWRERLDSVALAQSEVPDAYFAASNLVCQYYLTQKNYELAMDEAIRLVNKAKKEQHVYGMMRSNEGLALVYQVIGRDSSAMVAFREGLTWLKKGPRNPSREIQYLSEMIVSALRSNQLGEAETLIREYDKILQEVERAFAAKSMAFPVTWHQWLVNSYYASLYTLDNQLDKARLYLDKAANYADKSDEEDMKYFFYRAQVLYYQKTGEYEHALEAINKTLNVDKEPVMLKTKVDILRAAGRFGEAIQVYEDLMALNVQINNEALNRQIHQLRTLGDRNDREKQNVELQYQTEQLALKKRQLWSLCGVLILLLILLHILYRYYKNVRKLKNDLQKEKDSLVISAEKLLVAKEEAERANQLKTAFIANISHEVRTPLNAIVGFSGLLAEEEYDEADKLEFTGMINKNSELLLNLINDVLNLSRLESGNVHYTYKPVDIITHCKELVESYSDRVPVNVNMTFTTPYQTYILNTDIVYVRQLLSKILWNAIKFTVQGEINFSFEVDEAKGEARFAVSDTGCGIPVEKQSLIFERFEKLDDFSQGTGLGLPICLMIARVFGGQFYIDSSYVHGARFVFIHPLNIKP